MRILHTSDWHLGQHFMGKSREAEHLLFIQWLLKTVNDQKVDAVLIAGDIFDTGTPPSYARKLYNQFIVDLQSTCCRQLVIVGGNHDSVATLNESRDLLACLNTHVIGGVLEKTEDQIVPLNDANGQPEAVVCAIPYIRPRDVLQSQAGDSETDKQLALQNAIADHYKTAFELASEHSLPVIATGHLTTVGGQLTESVREIYIGTLSAFPVNAFPAADYIALGHLHRAQTVAGQENIRYSGSPIPLSFDEMSRQKQVVLVDVSKDEPVTITELDVPLFRPLKTIKGEMGSIKHQLQLLDSTSELNPWLEIVIETEGYVSDLQEQIDNLVADLPVEVLRVRRVREKSAAALARKETETLDELDISDVFLKRLAEEELESETSNKLTSAFNEVLEIINEETEDKEVTA